MIPHTYPCELDTSNRQKMLVYQVPSIAGLTKWIDYIPVKSPESESDLTLANTFANEGFILTTKVNDITGLVPFKDYVPIYLDSTATKAWSADNDGYIPMAELAGLLLDFTTGSLDSRINFSRTSNATVTRADGIIGFAPHNLLTFSEQFDNAVWGKIRSTITANSAAAPDGANTADKLVEDSSSSNTHQISRSTSVSASLPYTYSVYIKAAGRNFAGVRYENGAGTQFYQVNVNLTNGTATTTSFGSPTQPSFSVVNFGNDWWRVAITVTAADTSFVSVVYSQAVQGANSYTGDGISGLFIWGAQLEQNSTATTYNPTTVKNLLGFSESFDNAAWTKSNSFVQTNLLTYSEDFSNAAWNKNQATVTANTTIAPNGYLTADALVENNTTNFHFIQQNYVKSASNIEYTFSVYCKAGTKTWATLFLADGSFNGIRVYYNLSGNGSVGSFVPNGTGFSNTSATITNVGNGWYRLTITGTSTTSTTNIHTIAPATGDNGGNYLGVNGAEALYIWGAQLVQGSVAGDYRRTDAAALPIFYPNHNGVVCAQKLVEDAANSSHNFVQAVNGAAFVPYTYSIYAKKAERTKFGVWLRGALSSNRFQVGFDLSSGTVFDPALIGNFTNGSASITDVGNGWYRCSVTATTGSGETSIRGQQFILDGNASITSTGYQGDGTSGIYIFGAQLSDSASLDPYVLNAGAAQSAAAFYGPRFDYDPVTKEPKGLLIEEQRSNLLVQSETLGTSWILSSAVLTENTSISPDGTQDADKLVANNSLAINTILLYQEVSSLSASTAYTGSIYLKASNQTSVTISMAARDSGGGLITRMNCTYNLSAVTTNLYATGTFTNTSATITSVGNGWYRCTLTGTSPALTQRIRFELANAVLGDGVSGFLAWGAQLEAGAFASSYIPTAASQVTRTADVATIAGSNFYSWYNQNEGTIFGQGQSLQNATILRILSSSDGTASNFIALRNTTALGFSGQIAVSSTDQVSFGVGDVSGIFYKKAIAYKLNDSAFSSNNSTPTTDTAVNIPLTNQMTIGFAPTGYGNGHIKSITYYPTRLSNTVLQGLTA